MSVFIRGFTKQNKKSNFNHLCLYIQAPWFAFVCLEMNGGYYSSCSSRAVEVIYYPTTTPHPTSPPGASVDLCLSLTDSYLCTRPSLPLLMRGVNIKLSIIVIVIIVVIVMTIIIIIARISLVK